MLVIIHFAVTSIKSFEQPDNNKIVYFIISLCTNKHFIDSFRYSFVLQKKKIPKAIDNSKSDLYVLICHVFRNT